MSSLPREQSKSAVSPAAEKPVTETISAPSIPRNWFAQITGILVFLLGLAIILFVLRLGFEMYNDPAASLQTFQKAGNKEPNIGMAFAGLILRIGLLFFGSVSGSLIANKGINLYFTSLRRD